MAICENTLLGEVRMTTCKGKLHVFSAEGMEEIGVKVMDDLYLLFMYVLNVVCERKVERLEVREGKEWKTVSPNGEMNVIKGQMWLLAWVWIHATILEKDSVTLMKNGSVKWWNSERKNEYNV